MDLAGLSITELKQMLARVNHDLKMNKPTVKRVRKSKEIIPSLTEADICNQYAAKYTGTKSLSPSVNARIIADIQIQKDILEYINNGGNIIEAKQNKSKKNSKKVLSVNTLSLYKKISL
jgi:DNA primase